MNKEQILPTVTQMDAAIDTIITKMYGGLESASIEHFLETGKVNGSFRERLYDCIKTTFMLVDIKQKTEYLNAKQGVAKEREKHEARIIETIESMDDIMKEELSKEREKAKKLEHSLKMCVDVLKGLDATDYVAYTAGKVALIEYNNH